MSVIINNIIADGLRAVDEFHVAWNRSKTVPDKPFDFNDLFFPVDWKAPYEQSWENTGARFFSDHFMFFFVISFLYVPMVFGLKWWMRNREPYDLRVPLVLWNFALSAFSGIGAYIALQPLLISPEVANPVLNVLGCTTWCYRFGYSAQWVFWFDLSKIFEWIDTLFVVLRKKQLIYLHWYHHIITWLFCWYMNQRVHYYSCIGYYFALMNYTVHFFMYGYYGVTAMGFKPPIDFLITLMQILQMVFGIGILTYGATCDRVDWFGTAFGLFMYFSFFALFVKLYLEKYLFGSASRPSTRGKGSSKGSSSTGSNTGAATTTTTTAAPTESEDSTKSTPKKRSKKD